MGTLLFSLTLVGPLMGLVAGSAMQWLTLNLLGICCLRICRPSLATLRPGPRGRLLHPLMLAFVPFLRLLKVPPLRCCAGSWRRDPSPG